jgi:hypothetical protein
MRVAAGLQRDRADLGDAPRPSETYSEIARGCSITGCTHADSCDGDGQ